MKFPKMPLLGMAAAAAMLALPAAAQAAWHNAYTTADVNMRAGPSTGYRVITTVPAGANVHVYGCQRGWNWCDTSWAGHRGWVSGHYLTIRYHGQRRYLPDVGIAIGVPFLGWNEYGYWHRHYRHHEWYRNHRWDRRDRRHDHDRWDRDHRRREHHWDRDRRDGDRQHYNGIKEQGRMNVHPDFRRRHRDEMK